MQYFVYVGELTAKDKKEAAEIRLINAYADRPGLYNKTIQKTLSPEDKERLSVEVAESTNASEFEVVIMCILDVLALLDTIVLYVIKFMPRMHIIRRNVSVKIL